MEDMLWKDRKRHLGLPISFTKYSLSGGEAPRIFRETGLFNLKEEEVLLYRVRDITLTRSFFQRIFGSSRRRQTVGCGRLSCWMIQKVWRTGWTIKPSPVSL